MIFGLPSLFIGYRGNSDTTSTCGSPQIQYSFLKDWPGEACGATASSCSGTVLNVQASRTSVIPLWSTLVVCCAAGMNNLEFLRTLQKPYEP